MSNGDFISEMRKALMAQKLSQKDIAQESGLSQSAICKFINDTNPNVRFQTVLSLWPIAFGAPFPSMPRSEKAS